MPTEAIKITRFGGEAPRLASELLPESYAQYALNCKLTSGDIEPYRRARSLIPTSVTDPLTIYPMVSGTNFYWNMWATDVDVARAAVVDDTNTQRIYYTGDGVPKVTDFNRATFATTSQKSVNYTVVAGDKLTTIECTAAITVNLLAAAIAKNQFAIVVKNTSAGSVTIDPNGAELIDGAATKTLAAGGTLLVKCSGTAWSTSTPTSYPYDYFDLGLPAPTVAPVIAFDTLSKSGAYTVVAGDTGKTIDCSSTPWTLALTAAATLGSEFIVVVRNLGTGDLTIDPNGSELINGSTTLVIKSGEVGLITCNGTAFSGATTNGQFKSYVYTWVSAWGEESQPSPPSDLLLLASGQTCLVSTLPSAPPVGRYDVTKVRLYRTNYASSGTEYQYVTEIDVGTTTYTDTVTDDALAEVLPSTDWEQPPTTMQGLVAMANGMMAGFIGNTVKFCEPYQPYAWPSSYDQVVDYPIVAISAYGNTLVITTEGTPYVGSGNHPESVSLARLDVPYPCVSKRGMVNMGTGVMYPTFEGLVFVSGTSAQLATLQVFTRTEWLQYNPDSLYARFYDGKYFATYTNNDGARASFIFQAAQDRVSLLISSSTAFDAAYSDLKTGELYFVVDNTLYQWDETTQEELTIDWWSKDYVLNKPTNLGACRIIADYPDPLTQAEIDAVEAANNALTETLGELNGSEINLFDVNGSSMSDLPLSEYVTFTMYTDKAVRFTRPVYSSEMFRLPSGFKTDTWSFRVSAPFRIRAILVAETPAQLEGMSGA